VPSATLDRDGDGYTDVHEVDVLGSDPNDVNSPVVGGATAFTWTP
jgi:hypothetical protein